jgi:amino acid transporter
MTTTESTDSTVTTPSGPGAPGTSGTPSSSSRLVPRLGLLSLVVFGLAYMSPSIVVSTFGVIASTAKGAAPTAYLVATVAMTLTALSYGKLARAYPASGSVYTYARRLLDARIGFLAGWALLLDYFFLPMVAWLITALYMNVQFPVLPVWGWLLVLIALTTVVNTMGIVIADRVNKVLLALTAVALAGLVVVCLHAVGGSPDGTLGSSLWSQTTSVGAVTAAAAIAAYSFLGFDAVSTLSEEVVDAERNVPRGILLSVLIGGGIFFVIALLMQWVHPGGAFHDESTAGYAVATLVGGKGFADVFNVLTLIGGLASCVAIQASTTRLMYVMGRDGVLPRRAFGYLHPTFRTPVFNLLLIAAAGLLATRLSLATATSFINFGAFLAFTVVNVCVIAAWLRARREARTGHLPLLGYVVLPVLGAVVDVYLITKLGPHAVLLGSGWLVVGVVYLLVLTRGLRVSPPVFSLDDAPEPSPMPDAT